MSLLLSPAGNRDSFIAAVQNGADEVYLGLDSFNARANAENFTIDTLEPLIKYAHVRGVKVHITLNTLLHDSELPEAEQLALSADKIGADAFIIQDLGLAGRLSGKVGAALHASTQLTCYNIEGAKMLADIGFSRVVLARELPLNEIAEISAANICETEVFCHGALCVSYSGQCMLSFAENPARSGNRGTCSQPCRLKYSKNNDKFLHLLSPSDLCSLSYLEKLTETGVTSLKIEGRLKSPEYVAAVTRAYRFALDNPGKSVDNELDNLATIFSRGGFCSGHQLGKLKTTDITRDYAGRTGLYCGKTLGKMQIANEKIGTYRFSARLVKPLSVGDGLTFYGHPNCGGIVNVINKRDDYYDITVCGTMPKVKEPLTFYKTLDFEYSKLLKKSITTDLESKKVPLDAKFDVSDDFCTLTLIDPEKRTVTVTRNTEKTDKSLSRQQIRENICATGGTPFTIDNFSVSGSLNNFSIPFSEIKKMRREAIEKIEKAREARI